MIISFTGPRPPKIGGYDIPNPIFNHICRETEKTLLELKPDKCISGMALGYDTYAAKICIKLGIPFIAAVPFEGQDKVWKEDSKKEYKELLDKAVEVVYTSDPGYAAWKMQVRNEWMVDNSDIVIACFNGSKGGTFNCVKYATSKDKKVIIINPNEVLF